MVLTCGQQDAVEQLAIYAMFSANARELSYAKGVTIFLETRQLPQRAYGVFVDLTSIELR